MSSTQTARAVGAPQTQQVVVDGAVGRQPLDERDARLRIDEAIAIERTDVGFRRFAGVAEDQLEVRVGGDRRRGVGRDCPDVDAFMNGFEEPRERCRLAASTGRDYTGRAGFLRTAIGRGVRVVRRSSRPFLFDRGADVHHGRARRVHLHRLLRDVDAHVALHAVRLPLDDVAVDVARRGRNSPRCRDARSARTRRSRARSSGSPDARRRTDTRRAPLQAVVPSGTRETPAAEDSSADAAAWRPPAPRPRPAWRRARRRPASRRIVVPPVREAAEDEHERRPVQRRALT